MTTSNDKAASQATPSTNKNQVRLTIVTLSGNYEGVFNVHQQLAHVAAKALDALNIKPPPGEVWILSYGDQILDQSQTIEFYRLPDGAVLQFAAQEGGGGHAWTRR